MKIQSTTTDLSGMPGFIEPINYDKLKSSDAVEKMFTVKDGVFSCPVTVYYEMDSPYTFNRKFGFVNSTVNLNWEYKEQQDSPEKLVEQFLWNEDAVINWINDDIKKDLPMLSQFQIRKIEKIVLLKGKDAESDRFLRTEYQISSEVIMQEEEVIKLIKAHPKYEALQKRAHQIAEENEALALENEKNRKLHIVKNNYEMWKALNAKKEAGEFDQFMND